MSQVHVLVIDDDRAVRDVLQETLTQEGFAVSIAGDGAEGIQVAKDTPVQIVVTDFQLPDINGLEIIDRLARLDAKIIPIMMTGFGTIETAVRAMKSGAFDFITNLRGWRGTVFAESPHPCTFACYVRASCFS